jgi:NADPH:quinone reductase-like Zn-dependent oxidoreductase
MLAAMYSDFSADMKDFSAVSIEQVAVPALGPDDVLVRVVRAAANPIDNKVLTGALKDTWNHPLPFIMGYDFSGIIKAVGENVHNLKPGEAVCAVNWGQGNQNAGNGQVPGGAFAEYIKIHSKMLSLKPSDVSFDTAAALPLVGTTAYEGLSHLHIHRGNKLLILGGTTAVGLLAAQMAKLKGAEVTVTCSSRNMDFAKQEKPDHIIDYTSTNWWESDVVYDAIFDTVGDKGTFSHAKKRLRSDGAFVSIVSMDAGVDPMAHKPLKAFFFCLSQSTKILDELLGLVQKKHLVLPIEAEYPFTLEGVRALLRKQEAGKSLGKNMLVIAKDIA